MDFRMRVKEVLRMCGHAMVSTVHDRLNLVDRRLQDVLEQNSEIAGAQTALLQSNIHLVETFPRLQAAIEQMETQLATQIQEQRAVKPEIQELRAGIQDMREQVEPEIQALRVGIKGIREQVDQVVAAKLELVQSVAALIENGQARDQKDREAGFATLLSLVDRISNLCETMGQNCAASLAILEPAAQETNRFLADQSVHQVCVETSDYVSTNPELGLMSFLYSHLPGRRALDIGAHVGQVSEHLLGAGYEVYAFEPYPPSHARLAERLGGQPGFHAFNLALGSADGELPLHLATDSSDDARYDDPTVFNSLARHGMPEGLSFHHTVPVEVRRLSDLHRDGIVPPDISLVKIDTEGYDLEVIRGMDDHRYPVVVVEFWDTHTPFARQGLLYRVEEMAGEMRQRGYHWYIVLYRVWGENQIGFFCNHDRPVPNSWGNIVFFRESDTFAQAQQWCSAVLPRTYFKPVAPSRSRSTGS
jgi:FkbM family methyltransferase